ncbi:glycosyl hydrolase 115 family protein [Psychrosphaera sp. B3R10]|uniref:glycosyl hydrolase 115 family protein n=1 Tax=unclassified Psychrosphaera TaxID=2641570 RepID=UPI001C07F6F0|nr:MULTISPECIES: glycosyl hydrolase 115 family protein [unclassified Psychrosphaera]MBU2883965.1 glycosyl hydrolase 115 family protein [Psychrosphaera sp. I2R16]MBU2990370.1 glycosyl hydrolase 115 family protein [Psychrosphaera sp. B3R10]
MKSFSIICNTIVALFICILSTSISQANDGDYVLFNSLNADFGIVQNDRVADIYVDKSDHKGVLRAVNNLQADIKKVTGKLATVSNSNHTPDNAALIIVGTIGRSALIDLLVHTQKLDVESLQGQWEAFRIEVIDNPFPQSHPSTKKALVIVGSDKRGTTFGVYDLAEKIGVSPWYWWADVPVKQSKQLYVKHNTHYQTQPKIKYRGIFLNDEAPALTNWVKAKFGEYNHQFYQHIFDLLLRLKANFLWPAMWNNAFSDDDPLNMVLADEYGIVMSNSHHEPMLCADKEWDRRGTGKWDYDVNAENLYQFWQKCAERNKPFESIYTLGMRGQHDTPMSENENIELLEHIVADQRTILSNVFKDREVSDVPQVWTLYKEVQSYYEKGMRVPDDVTLLWSDDNWGNIRRLPTPQERKRKGGAGVYYHFDYVGGPRSYRWINTTPIAKIWEQMALAYQFDAKQIWLTNVGDLKPMEYPTDFFLTYAWDPEAIPKEKLAEYTHEWVKQQFGDKYATQIASILTTYTRHNGRRKPELMDVTTYSQFNYNEADRISVELSDAVDLAERINNTLSDDKKSAYFQLVLHPIKATANLYELYNNVAKNRLYASQGRASANKYAAAAQKNFETDAALKATYHQLNNGRWAHFMDQTHIGYTHWNNPPADVMPWLATSSPANVSDMGVAVEGTANVWPHIDRLVLDQFSPFGQKQRYIDVFNKGLMPFEFSATASKTWVTLSHNKGLLTNDTRILVGVDWANAPKGELSATVFIKGTGWGGATVNISAFNPGNTAVRGFVEADGYVALEAVSAQALGSTDNASWQEIPFHGRTQSSMSAMSKNIDQSIQNYKDAPYLEYDLFLFNQGAVEIQTLVAPSLNFVPTRGLRFAIGFDDEEPIMVDVLENSKQNDWQESVKNGVRYAVSHHNVKQPGAHKLRIYMVDIGVVIQKVIVNTGGLKKSYLGPEQSMWVD